MNEEIIFLRKAIEIAENGIPDGCGPFGAVITRDGEIISSSCNRVVNDNDPTAHAEIIAIRKASALLGTYDLGGCTIYASCEPCPMCLGAIYWSGITKVIFASDRKDAASAGFDDEFIYNEISLDPSSRSLHFRKIELEESAEVFRKWSNFDKRRPY